MDKIRNIFGWTNNHPNSNKTRSLGSGGSGGGVMGNMQHGNGSSNIPIGGGASEGSLNHISQSVPVQILLERYSATFTHQDFISETTRTNSREYFKKLITTNESTKTVPMAILNNPTMEEVLSSNNIPRPTTNESTKTVPITTLNNPTMEEVLSSNNIPRPTTNESTKTVPITILNNPTMEEVLSSNNIPRPTTNESTKTVPMAIVNNPPRLNFFPANLADNNSGGDLTDDENQVSQNRVDPDEVIFELENNDTITTTISNNNVMQTVIEDNINKKEMASTSIEKTHEPLENKMPNNTEAELTAGNDQTSWFKPQGNNPLRNRISTVDAADEKDKKIALSVDKLITEFSTKLCQNRVRHNELFLEKEKKITGEHNALWRKITTYLDDDVMNNSLLMRDIKRDTDISFVLFNKYSIMSNYDEYSSDNHQPHKITKIDKTNDYSKCKITKLNSGCYITGINIEVGQIKENNNDVRETVKINLEAKAKNPAKGEKAVSFKIKGYNEKNITVRHINDIPLFVANQVSLLYEETQAGNKIKVFIDPDGSSIAVLYASQIELYKNLKDLKNEYPDTFNYLCKNIETAKKYIDSFTLMLRSVVLHPNAITHDLDYYMSPDENSLSINTGLQILQLIAKSNDNSANTELQPSDESITNSDVGLNFEDLF